MNRGNTGKNLVKRTVQETDTGGWVRNALRLKENEYKGTRPICSVTSGEGELVLKKKSVAENRSVRLGNNTTASCKTVR